MSFGEHLEELRKVLIRSLAGIAVGCVIGFWAAERVVEILQRPLEAALTKFYIEQGKRDLLAEHGFVSPEYSRLLDEEQKIPETVLIDPEQLLAGLRSFNLNPPMEAKRLAEDVDDSETGRGNNRPKTDGLPESTDFDSQATMIPLTIWKSARYKSQSLGATETFMIWVKAGVVSGLVISSPWVFFQLWSFVAAGLYPTEQKYVYIFLPVSLLLFFAGALLAFFFVFEPVMDFLFSFNARMGIIPQPRINDWLSFVMFLPLGFGVAFQLPLVMLFANRIELISVEAYVSKWRIAVVAIFALSMLLTPADPISMILLAIPLTGLYFLGILLCRRFNKPGNPFATAG